MEVAKRYDLNVGGQILRDLEEADITELFRSYRITSSTPCRRDGSTEWREVNEYFPLLKYGVYALQGSGSTKVPPKSEKRERLPYLTRWTVGVACLAIGLCAGAFAMLPNATVPPAISRPRIRYAPAAQPLSASAPTALQGITVNQQGSSGLGQVTYSNVSRSQYVSNRSSQTIEGAIQNRIPAARPQVTSKPVVKPEEFTIPLERWNTVNSTHGSFHVKIRDHGLVTITAWLDYGQPRRIEKEKGFETNGTNIVQIYSLPGAKVYYVDRIGVSPGNCVLKIIPNS